MKRKLLLLLLANILLMPGIFSQDTVRHVIFTKWNSGLQEAFLQITNVGDTSVDMSRFSLSNINASVQAADFINGLPVYNLGIRYTRRLPGQLEPGQSMLIMNVMDAMAGNDKPYQLEKMLPLADIKVHATDLTPFHPEVIPELELWGKDSVSTYDFLLRLWNGHHANVLHYHLPNGDSVMIDQVNLAYDPAINKLIERPSAVAGVSDATLTHFLVRKANIKVGNTNWDNARGISAEDSEWIPIPRWQGRTPYTTLKNFGNFSLSLQSSSAIINDQNNTITVEWGTEKGDSILELFTIGQGMGWQYIQNFNSADSAYNTVRSGDIVQFFACGNSLQQKDYQLIVAPPASDNARIFPLRNYSISNETWSNVSRYYVTKDAPVIDTIGNVPFATRVDTLLAYLEKAPGATWAFTWVDGQARVDLKQGDKLRVTAANGTTVKEYYIDVLDYQPSSNANLSAITWPDIPFFLEGWEGDTIPKFNPNPTSYSITIPFGTTSVPALKPIPATQRAKIQTIRATSLTGSLAERTTTFKVIAEDDSTTKQYEVIFTLKKPDENIQKFNGHPFISEIVTNMNSHMSFIEIYNPRNVPLDLSEYIIVRTQNTLNPAQALSTAIMEGTDNNFQHRYRSYIPGYKYSDDLEAWKLTPGKIYIDTEINPIVEPGQTFVIGKAAQGRREMASTPHIENVVNKWFDGGDGAVTPEGVSVNQVVAQLKRNATALFLFKINNDSIFNGAKQVGEPADFELVDAFGGGATAGANPWIIAGKTIANNNVSRIRLKPHVFQGVSVPGQNAGTNAEDSDWIVDKQPEDIAMANLPLLLGSHVMDPVTIHLSTVSSLTYLVSEGYEGLQSIQGNLSGKTLEAFYLDISKAHPEQVLTLKDHSDGSEKSPEDLVSGGDTLIVVSANGENTTKYLLVNQPLDNNAVLVAAEGSGLTIDISDNTGAISGMGYDATLREVLDGVIKPEHAVLHIIDGEGTLIPLRMMNYDTVYVEVKVSDRYFFEVLAQDGVTKITYQLSPVALSSDAFVTSTVYTVDQDSLIISGIPNGTTVPVFFENINIVRGATSFVEDKKKFAREAGFLVYDDRLVVISEDQTVTVTYYLDFMSEENPDRPGGTTHIQDVRFNTDQLEVYPNPTSDRFYLKGVPEDAIIYLSDLSGRIISIRRSSDIHDGISISDQPAGMYLLMVRDNSHYIGYARIVKK